MAEVAGGNAEGSESQKWTMILRSLTEQAAPVRSVEPPAAHTRFMSDADREVYAGEFQRAAAVVNVVTTLSHMQPIFAGAVRAQQEDVISRLLTEAQDACANMALVRQRALARHMDPADKPATRRPRRKTSED